MSLMVDERSLTDSSYIRYEDGRNLSRGWVKSSIVSFATGAFIAVGTFSPASGVASAPLVRSTNSNVGEWTAWDSPFAPGEGKTLTVKSTAEMVAGLHAESGLTWEQLARALGVSRRSLHLWAAGAKVSAANQEKVARIYALVADLPAATPEDKRALFFAHRPGVPSIYDEIVNSSSRRGVEAITSPVRALGIDSA